MTKLKTQCLILAVAFSWQAAGAASLIHHWALDGDATDSAGTVDGAVQNGAGYAMGQFGQAISLDGVDQSISMGAVTIVPSTDYTLTAWVFWEAGNSSRGYIAGGQNSGSEGEVFTMGRASDGTDTKLFLNSLPNNATSITESPDGTISSGVWQHVAYSIDSTSGTTIYLNGSSVGTNPDLKTHTPAANFNIGRSTSTAASWFDGLIDDVAIFDGVLSTTELANVRDLGAANFAVPEPSVAVLLGLGSLGLLRRRR